MALTPPLPHAIMSRSGRKRTKSTEIPAISRKRRKLDAIPVNDQIKTKPSPGTPPAIYSANDLAWKEVARPEWLDDAEGFYGLEEVDHVEVVQAAKGKAPRFRVCPHACCSISHILMDPLCLEFCSTRSSPTRYIISEIQRS